MGRYYLRIPVPGGRGDQFADVEIDPGRLHLGVLTDIYERLGPAEAGSQRRGARSGLKPALGVANTIRRDVDPTAVVQTLTGLLARCREALQPFGEAGKQIEQVLPDETNFRQLIESLAKGQLGAADEALAELLYQVMGAARTLAEHLQQAQAYASAMDASRASLDAALREAPAITEELYFEWAEAADTLNRTVQKLAGIESDLEALLLQAKGVGRTWQALVSDQHPVIVAAVKHLDFSADSFNLWTFAYLRHPDPNVDVGERTARARQHIEAGREQERIAQDAWQRARANVHEATTPQLAEIQRMCLWLDEATINFQRIERRIKPEVARPCDVRVGELISPEDYQRARTILTDPKWSPRTAQRRLEGLTANVMALVREMPRLPESVLAAFTQTEQYLKQLEQLKPLPPPLPPDRQERTQTDAAPQRARVGELYELVVCAGYVLTCSHQRLAQSNIEALIEVLVQLDRCSDEEAVMYRAAVVACSEAPGEREEVPAGVSIRERWEASAARWLVYRVRRVPRLCLKLAKKAGLLVPALLAKHNLSEADIHAAHKRRREIKLHQYQERKAKRLAKGS